MTEWVRLIAGLTHFFQTAFQDTAFFWFGAVDEKAEVWVNGTLLGVNDLPSIALPGRTGKFKLFESDATEAIRFGQPNYVAVKITNTSVNEIRTRGIVTPVMFWTPR